MNDFSNIKPSGRLGNVLNFASRHGSPGPTNEMENSWYMEADVGLLDSNQFLADQDLFFPVDEDFFFPDILEPNPINYDQAF